MHPEWRGIRRSLENHCSSQYLLEDHVTPETALAHADFLVEKGAKKLVYGALPLSYSHLIRCIHQRHPKIEQFITWHGSYLQSNEDYNWESFKGALCLCREGSVKRLGFVKKGMEKLVSRLDIEAVFYSNFVDQIPSTSSVPEAGGPHLGLWAIAPIWRKNPYAMLAGAAMIPNACLHVRGQDERVREFAELFSIRLSSNASPLEMSEVEAEMKRMHLNLYITMSECSPMTPLESLSAGVPCLLGPNSHLFEDNRELFDLLVVPFPDRSDVVTDYITCALEEREGIVSKYASYAVEYNARAKQEFAQFIGA